MARARWCGGVLVVLMGVAGLLVALSSTARANPLWQVWAALAVSLCASAGLVAVHGRAQWRELAVIRPLRERSTILPTAVLCTGALVVVVLGEVLAARPGAAWRGDVLVLLAVFGGAWAGAAMFAGAPADRADLVDRAEQRAKLEQAIGADRTLFGELQTALPVLGPLIAAAAVFLPR